MKKEDKELIYDLLKKTDAYVTGYTSPAFTAPVSFKDDVELEQKVVQTNNALTLADLNAKILRCTKCQLARTRNNVVPGEGVEGPEVLVIGEGPGYDEDMSGRPFVGKAGLLLDKMLAAIGLDRTKN